MSADHNVQVFCQCLIIATSSLIFERACHSNTECASLYTDAQNVSSDYETMVYSERSNAYRFLYLEMRESKYGFGHGGLRMRQFKLSE